MEPEQEPLYTVFFKSWLAAEVNQLSGVGGNFVKTTEVQKIVLISEKFSDLWWCSAIFPDLPVSKRLRLRHLIFQAFDIHGIKVRKSFLFRFRRRVILKGQNSAKNRLSKFETRHTPQTIKFWTPNAEFYPLSITNTFSTFTGKTS